MKPLKRTARRRLLVAHAAVSVSWLGLTVGLLTLRIAAFRTNDPETAWAATRAMKIFGDWLIVPFAMFSLLSGLALSLGTPWGLARHRVFWLTLVAAALSVFALRPAIDEAAARGSVGFDLIVAPTVATTTYLFVTAISGMKPWGTTRPGRRLHRTADKGKGTVGTGKGAAGTGKGVDAMSSRRSA
ncbi:DUF2269 domain-containing protein [Streptomyces sp. NPDC002476]|uniref:DUF2269 domain-containing protein n=1 Tax=Streptomyces sp. NPDC002476 TaxID=3364648 RepID=UPI0036C11D7C